MNLVSYPMHNLSTMVEIIKKAYKGGKLINKQILANACTKTGQGSTKSGIFNHKLAALKHYNLATVEGNLVTFTLLAEKIVMGEPGSLEIAFLAPQSFKELYETVEKNTSINKETLEDIASLQIGISEVGKRRFVSNFVKSGIYANLVEQSLKSRDEVVIIEKEESPEIVQGKPIVQQANVQKAELTISAGKATIIVPKELNLTDKDKLKAQIDIF